MAVVSKFGVVALLLLFVTACADGVEDAPPEGVAFADDPVPLPDEALDEPPLIGLAVQNLSRSFFQGLEAGARGEAEVTGTTLLVADAGDDADQQLADVQRLIDQGVHGLIVSPVDSGAAVEIADLAQHHGVPLVSVANQIGTVADVGPQYVYPGTVALVTNDDLDMGRKAATFVAETLGDESIAIAIIEGKDGTANSVMRRTGFTDELDALGMDYEIVASAPGDWTAEGGARVCREVLELETVQVVFSMSDAMTAGCADVLDGTGRSEVVVVSIGGNAAGIELLGAGRMAGTVCQKPGTMGALAVSTLVDALLTVDFDQGLRFYETPVVTVENQMATCIPQW